MKSGYNKCRKKKKKERKREREREIEYHRREKGNAYRMAVLLVQLPYILERKVPYPMW